MSVHTSSIARHNPASIALFFPDRAQGQALDLEPCYGGPPHYELDDGNVAHLIDDQSGQAASAPPLAPDEPFHHTPQGGVEFDEAKMEIDRPYPFKVNDIWFVSVKRSVEHGDVRLYQLA